MRRPSRQTTILLGSVTLVGLGSSVTSPVLPDIQREFTVTAAEVGLLTSSWALARLVLDLPFGALVQRLDQQRVLLAATILLVVGAILSAVAESFGTLLVGRFVSGVGGAIFAITIIVALLEVADPNERGSTMGYYQASLQAGTSMGPVFAGFLGLLFGWQAAFAFGAVSGLVAWLFIRTTSGSPSDVPHRGADRAGTSRPVARAWLSITAISVTTFSTFFVVGGMIMLVLPLYAADRIHMNAAEIGLLFGAATGIRFVMSIVGSSVSDTRGRLTLLVPGFLLMSAVLLVLPAISEPLLFVVATLLLALGRVGNAVPIAMLADIVGSERLGRHIGFNRFIADLALVTGPIVTGFMAHAFGYATAFYASAALFLVSVALLLVTRWSERSSPVAAIPVAGRRPGAAARD